MSQHAHASNQTIEKKDIVDILKVLAMFFAGAFLWVLEFSFIESLFKEVVSVLIIYLVGEHLTSLPHNVVFAITLISIFYKKPAFFAFVAVLYFVSFIMLFSI